MFAASRSARIELTAHSFQLGLWMCSTSCNLLLALRLSRRGSCEEAEASARRWVTLIETSQGTPPLAGPLACPLLEDEAVSAPNPQAAARGHLYGFAPCKHSPLAERSEQEQPIRAAQRQKPSFPNSAIGTERPKTH